MIVMVLRLCACMYARTRGIFVMHSYTSPLLHVEQYACVISEIK